MTTEHLTYADLAALIPGSFGAFDAACPACGPKARAAVNKHRKVLRCWRTKPGFLSYCCARCGASGWVAADGQQMTNEPQLPASVAPMPSDPERTARALRLWREARSPRGTLVERYLRNRGLLLPPEAADVTIRYHGNCPFGPGVTTPCMVTLIRDIRTDEPRAIQRTALNSEGYKAEIGDDGRMTLGPWRCGAIKVTPDACVETVLGIGEGLESSMSLRHWRGCSELPIWAALSADGLASFPVLGGIETLWIAADHDERGAAAVEEVAARWTRAGRDVEIIRPRKEGLDLNDLVRDDLDG